MAEREPLVEKDKVVYEGPFDLKQLYKLIDEWARTKAYLKVERKHTEVSGPKGKTITYVFEFSKKLSDYAKSIIRLGFQVTNLTKEALEHAEDIHEYDMAKVDLTFDAILETDYEGRWEGRPVQFFIRTLFDRYVYRGLLAGYEKAIRADMEDLKENTKAFLNLFRP
jgi:hypothetical protein